MKFGEPNLKGYEMMIALQDAGIKLDLKDVQTFLYGDAEKLVAERYADFTWDKGNTTYPIRMPALEGLVPVMRLFVDGNTAWYMMADGRFVGIPNASNAYFALYSTKDKELVRNAQANEFMGAIKGQIERWNLMPKE